jgi:aspartyl-tRNA(Asn)/glutamyl-tRNA(Gln) amidotransferase subunit A
MKLKSIAEASEQIRQRNISPVDLAHECLQAIEQHNPFLNAFITVTADSALEEAKLAEAEVGSGRWRGPLHGIPIGLKDLIDTAGVRTTAASAIFLDRVPSEDAEVVKKLKAAGAILIGKQNLHEFAYGGSSLVSHYGAVRNPVNPEFIAGGSSGGSAAAVATGMCFAAIGTDTAGSIRQPAALCGVVGLKPTHGLVSTRGVIPLSTSLDDVGLITRTVEDAAILLDAIAKTPSHYPGRLSHEIKNFRLGIPRKYFFESLDSEILAALERAIDQLKDLGGTIRELELAVNDDRTVFLAESHRYHRDKIRSSPELYHPETLRRVQAGAEISEAEYRSALLVLMKMRREIREKPPEVDVLVTPTTPVLPPRISDLTKDITQLRPMEIVLLRNTRPMNVWGLPAISVPCGTTSAGLPIGLQIAAAPGKDAQLLRIAHAFEHLSGSK